MTRWLPAVALTVVTAAAAHAQTIPAARVAILLAEERGARDARDLATLRAGIRNADGETARAAIRALGRLGRPALVPDIAAALKSPLPELRTEAADALASAATTPASAATVLSTLLARLAVEAEPNVRGAIGEALGRLRHSDTSLIVRAERAVLALARSDALAERLGAVRGLESLVRINAGAWSPGAATIATLRELLGVAEPVLDPTGAESPSAPPLFVGSPLRDARVRRLALEALAGAGAVDQAVMERASIDLDPQVRRLAMRAAAAAPRRLIDAATTILQSGVTDPNALVRIEALRGEGTQHKGEADACRHFVQAVSDASVKVALVALDLLADCGAQPGVTAVLELYVNDLSAAGSNREWHRPAHALVSLSSTAPDRAAAALAPFTRSGMWAIRAYAARAAIVLNDRSTLETLAADGDSRVAAIARNAIGRPVTSQPASGAVLVADTARESDLNTANLQRLKAPRARVTIRAVGSFELALFTWEAPAGVLRFARLAEAGHYNGVTIGGLLPTTINLVADDRGAGVSNGDVRGEVGSWPHVRGTLGFSTDIFIDLVDNPRFDHTYPVFAQVLNGIDVLDQILEGDVIDRIEILSGP